MNHFESRYRHIGNHYSESWWAPRILDLWNLWWMKPYDSKTYINIHTHIYVSCVCHSRTDVERHCFLLCEDENWWWIASLTIIGAISVVASFLRTKWSKIQQMFNSKSERDMILCGPLKYQTFSATQPMFQHPKVNESDSVE